MLHCGRPMRFANDMYQAELAEVSHLEYINHLKTLTTKLYTAARSAQRIAQHESAHYFNKKHGIKRDIRTDDLVLKKHLPSAAQVLRSVSCSPNYIKNTEKMSKTMP